jgi:hypothetical protein
MDTVNLPVAKPPIYGYQFYGFPLSIMATDDDTRDWMLSNFVNVEYDARGQACDVPFCFSMFDYAQSPWLEHVRLDRRYHQGTDIVEVIWDALRRGYYVYTFLDEFHVPHREWYQQKFFPHDVLIHGYDGEADAFSLLGFDERFTFRTTRISRDALERAYHALDATTLEGKRLDEAPFLLWRFRSQPEYGYGRTVYPLDVPLIRRSLGEYLEGVDEAEHYRALRRPRDVVSGVDCYEPLAEYLDLYLQGEVPFDVRHLHVLWEHKHMMVLRLRRLERIHPEVGDLVEPFERVENLAHTLRNALLRRRLTRGRGPAPRWGETLKTIERSEREILERLVGVLDGDVRT